MNIVGRNFSPARFAEYLEGIRWDAWVPSGITVHHCSAPSLAQRPQGFARQHMDNLAYYYGTRLGWSAGPHLFVDDDEIWVFSPLHRRGVHAVSFNATDIGIEMLGDYDKEDPWSGRGLAVLTTTAKAIVALQAYTTTPAIRFHRDDPLTSKTCPGMRISKQAFLDLVESERGAR